jgi:transcriptional regulator with XRE-family HTH domain
MSRSLGDRVRKYRNRLGLSQEALAHRIGRSEGWMLLVENGRADPAYSDLLHLAEVLQVETIQLIEDEAESSTNRRDSRRAAFDSQSTVTNARFPAMMDSDPGKAGDQPGDWLEEMRRRAFLRAAATLTGATAMGWWPALDQGAADPLAATTLRDALLGYRPCRPGVSDSPGLASLRQAVRELWRARQESRYSAVERMAPNLLRQALVTVSDLTGDDRLAAMELLAEVYQNISGALRKIGDLSMATVAADRAMVTADGHGSTITLAKSARFMCSVLSDSGHHDQAVRVCSSVADRLESEELRRSSAPDPLHLSVYGQLLLAGGCAAAQKGDRRLTEEFFATAERAGGRLGADGNHGFTTFGPTNITVYRVHAAVVLGDGESAVRQARNVDLSRLPVLERRAHHLLDVAHGHNLINQPEEAAVSLLTAETIAPEEVRCGPGARLLVEQLRHRNRELSSHLGALADRMQSPAR